MPDFLLSTSSDDEAYLFLVGLLFGRLARLLLALAVQLLVDARLAQHSERLVLLVVFCDGARLLGDNGLLHRHQHVVSDLGHSAQLLGSSISLLGSRRLLREEDQLALVLLQTLHIDLKGFDGLVAATVINGDTDALGLFGVDSSSLKLIKSKAATSGYTSVVLEGLTAYNRAQCTTYWARGDLAGLLDTVVASANLASRLVEPGAHEALP